MSPSPAIESDIMEKVRNLEKFHSRIISCRVVVNAPHKHKHKGKLYQIHIDIGIPGERIVVSRDAGFDYAHEDVYVAIRDSFDAAKRKLEDYVRKRSGFRSKHHPTTESGEVVRLFYDDGYGGQSVRLEQYCTRHHRDDGTKPFFRRTWTTTNAARCAARYDHGHAHVRPDVRADGSCDFDVNGQLSRQGYEPCNLHGRYGYDRAGQFQNVDEWLG